MRWKHLFVLLAISGLWSAPVSADDFAKSCQVILQSEATICGTSGTAEYQAAFTNLVPKYLIWQKVWTDQQGGQQTETYPPEPANLEAENNFLITSKHSEGESVSSVQQTSDGGYVLAGSSFVSGKFDCLVQKYDKTGNLEWENNAGASAGNLQGLIVKPSGGGYAAAGLQSQRVPLFVKYDSDGNVTSSVTGNQTAYFPPGFRYGNVLQNTSDGGYILTGLVHQGADFDIVLNKYAAGGALTWSKKTGATPDTEFPYGVRQTQDGGYILAGSIWSADAAGSWTETRPAGNVDKDWSSVASSTDGSRLIAGAYGRSGSLYISADGGSSWSETRPADPHKSWIDVASSADGTRLIAGEQGGRLYISSNGGSSWSETRPAGDVDNSWYSVASSADGSRLIAGACTGRLYISSNGGSSWSETRPAGDVDKCWINSVTSGADGSHLIVGTSPGRLYVSSNGGTTWTETQPAGNVDKHWQGLASSADGNKLIAGVYGVGRLYISADGGSSWSETRPAGDVDKSWYAVASSADGNKLVAGTCFGGRLYVSSNGGFSWSETQPAGDVDKCWGNAVASSADGNKLVAGNGFGRLYVGATGYFIGQGRWDSFVAKFDGSGNLSWARTAGSPDIDSATAVDQLDDGGYLVAGETRALDSSWGKIFFSKYDASGNLLWFKYINSNQFMGNGLSQVVKTSDGGFAAVGLDGENGNSSRLLKFDKDGNLLWAKKITIGGDAAKAVDVQQTDDGGYVVAGNVTSVSYIFLLKTDPEGNVNGCGSLADANPSVADYDAKTTVPVLSSSSLPGDLDPSNADLSRDSLSSTNNPVCQYSYTPPSEITKNILYTGMSAYTLNLTAEEQDGTQTPCESFSTVTVTDKKTCEMVPGIVSGDGTPTPITKDANDIYKVYAGQTVGVEPSLFCLKPGGSTGWTNQGGNLLSSTNTLMKLFFDTGGLVKAGGSYTDPDGNAAVCTDAGIQVRERLRVGF